MSYNNFGDDGGIESTLFNNGGQGGEPTAIQPGGPSIQQFSSGNSTGSYGDVSGPITAGSSGDVSSGGGQQGGLGQRQVMGGTPRGQGNLNFGGVQGWGKQQTQPQPAGPSNLGGGYSGGSGGGGGYGGGGGSYSTSAPGMIPGMKGVYDQLLGINQQRYGNVTNAYNQGQGNLAQNLPGIYQGYGKVQGDVMNTLGMGQVLGQNGNWGVASPAAQAIGQTYAANTANTTQQMTNAGLGNTTAVGSAQTQNSLSAAQAYGGLGAQLAQTAAGYQAQLGQAGLGAQMQGLGMQTGLTQAGMGAMGQQASNTAGSLTGSYGQSYSGSGGGGGGGGLGGGYGHQMGGEPGGINSIGNISQHYVNPTQMAGAQGLFGDLTGRGLGTPANAPGSPVQGFPAGGLFAGM